MHREETVLDGLRGIPRKEPVDPYPLYRFLHREAPVWNSPWGDVYVSRYADVQTVLRSPICHQRPLEEGPQSVCALSSPTPEMDMEEWPIFLNPPEHGAIRQALAKLIASTPQKRVRTIISDYAAELADRLEDGAFCFVNDFASRLPIGVICELCAIPGEDRARVAEWGLVLRDILDSGPSSEVPSHAEAMRDGIAYFEQLTSDQTWRRHAFGGKWPDIMGSVPERTAANNLFFLVFSGHETTIHLIGSLVRLLAEETGAWARLRDNRAMLPSVVDEALRLESPVHKACRVNSEVLRLSGSEIAAGSSIVLLIGAANRDPSSFTDPDRFDPTRSGPRHLAFGVGRHLCLGKALAVWEAEESLRVLLDKWTNVEMTGEPKFFANSTFRGMSLLPIIPEFV